MEYSKALLSTQTPIPGVILLDLPVHGDNRGWFKENWQREKMVAIGLPNFGPVQNNISFNETAGTTRGIHAEPWDKYVSVATGRVFGAWVDLREGPTFGTVFTAILDPSTAIFIPRGVGNAFQTLDDNTAYTYLVNDHWSAEAQEKYTFLNLADETVAIEWPINLESAELSDKDRNHPRIGDVVPMNNRRILVLGGNGQLGLALRNLFRENIDVEFATRENIDLSVSDPFAAVNWNDYHTVINAAAYTDVDTAETSEGRALAWKVNVAAVSALARACIKHRITLVHVSSDYVFDGTISAHLEDEEFSPLGVYGQTKAAGDAVVASVPKHYILRTSWVIGEGSNFVATMVKLAQRGIKPNVVNDQYGRLTFTQDIAAAINHLLRTQAIYGIYNISNTGSVQTWNEIASDVYEALGHSRDSVTGVSTEDYFVGKNAAARPTNSAFDLTKIHATGFIPEKSEERLKDYLQGFGSR